MELFKSLVILENQKQTYKELKYTCSLINKSYKEWRKVHRRINAVDIVTTTVNRLTKVHPNSVNYLDHEMKMKLGILLMRCMDLPHWKSVETKEKTYEKLFPLIKELENLKLNTGTGGSLKEVIMTRLSANLCVQNESINGKIFVSYEPHTSISYEKYLFGDSKRPEKIYKMQALTLPDEFDTLVHTLEINIEKAFKKYKSS